MTEPKPFFSVVMASYLGEYQGRYGKCASNREAKFIRAVTSLLGQTFTDWELIVVSDGCDITMGYEHQWPGLPIRFICMDKQRTWSEAVRNEGILQSHGRYVVYLDTDDMLMPTHLKQVHDDLHALGLPEWAIMNDWIHNPHMHVWDRRVAVMDRERGAGTSQIVHLSSMTWPKVEFRHPAMGYDHDEQFFRHLKHRALGAVLPNAGGYMVCHYPNLYDL